LSSLADVLRPVAALGERDYRILRSYPLALGFDVLFGIVDLLVYFFVSRTFGDKPVADLHGAPSYFAFVAVGIVMTLVVSAASAEVAYRLRDEQLTGTLEVLCAQPLAPFQMAFGLASFPFLFAAVRGAIYLGIAALMPGVNFGQADWLGCVVIICASAAALVGLGIGVAGVVLLLKRGINIVALIGLGLGLFGGAFFPLRVLPGWLRWVGDVVPTRYALDGLRAALFTGNGWSTDAEILVLCSAVTLPLGLAVFSAALAMARRRGSLAEY
jgi:ABC-2 type transport system permease protein